ncbi:hypothetical protein L1887_55511 [Cichorium endivia]|nr:hypothetical protein L1887_55511 [Cichorium endivia]
MLVMRLVSLARSLLPSSAPSSGHAWLVLNTRRSLVSSPALTCNLLIGPRGKVVWAVRCRCCCGRIDPKPPICKRGSLCTCVPSLPPLTIILPILLLLPASRLVTALGCKGCGIGCGPRRRCQLEPSADSLPLYPALEPVLAPKRSLAASGIRHGSGGAASPSSCYVRIRSPISSAHRLCCYWRPKAAAPALSHPFACKANRRDLARVRCSRKVWEARCGQLSPTANFREDAHCCTAAQCLKACSTLELASRTDLPTIPSCAACVRGIKLEDLGPDGSCGFD